jgi:transposase-like protein
MAQRDPYEEQYRAIVYISNLMAQVTCPRCGHDYQVTRNALQRRFLRNQDLPLHCLDCTWMVRRDNANK